MTPIQDYIQLPRETRRSHLDLTAECSKIGGTSKEFKGLLAYHLGTTIPSGRQVFLCHACHNGACSNVKHLYWGTPKDNYIDCVEDRGTLHERSLKIHGQEFLAKRYTSGSSAGGKGNSGRPKSEEHKQKIAESLRKKKNAAMV